ncbi:MAG: YihY/virulence factor BrkB family protein [Alkalispirochaetaceae bacterium]
MRHPRLAELLRRLAQIRMPWTSGLTLAAFTRLFRHSLSEGQVRTRSSAIAFQALLTAPPALYFLFTLLPYIPVANLEREFIELAGLVVPELTLECVEPLIRALFIDRRAAPVIGLLISLFTASNGVDNVIDAFHATAHEVESRPFLQRRIVSLALVVAIALLTTLAILLAVATRLVSRGIYGALAGGRFAAIALESGSWIVVILLVYLAVSLLYYYAPAERPGWRSVSVGGVLATIFVLIASWGFSFFLRHLAQLNRLFGSLGTLMAIMIWLKLVAFSVLLGFELNVTAKAARQP